MQLLPTPVGCGWTKEDEEDYEQQPVLMTQESAQRKLQNSFRASARPPCVKQDVANAPKTK